MLRHGLVVAALLLIGSSPMRAQADVPLVGIFEGHGFAHPEDPKEARAIRAAVRRLGLTCRRLYSSAGPLAVENKACPGARERVNRDGEAAIPALLDLLDDPRVSLFHTYETSHSRLIMQSSNWPTLLEALTDTGDLELIPVFIEARERVLARLKHPDPRIATGKNSVREIDLALARLTHTNLEFMAAKEEWGAWYRQHGHEPRAEWRRRGILRAKAALESEKNWVVEAAARWLLQFPETRNLGHRALKAEAAR